MGISNCYKDKYKKQVLEDKYGSTFCQLFKNRGAACSKQLIYEDALDKDGEKLEEAIFNYARDNIVILKVKYRNVDKFYLYYCT